ncbi:MAG: biotin synthase BioB [Deltaproteobacteria bacterium]|nr:biotin synthase BioB [Deltaproteobacteria bacterium]
MSLSFDAETIWQNNGISEAEALDILKRTKDDYFTSVMPVAKALREKAFGNKISFCSITNAKSGACVEDCKFCAQSNSYKGTLAPVYGLKSADQIVSEAKEASASGATEFSIVTSGRGMTKKRELDTLVSALERIHQETDMESCASLGLMSYDDLKRLRDAGMTNFHHNIETARSYFPNIVTTHTFDEEVESLKNARKLGFQICSGGILGMGESLAQRVEFAFDLKEIDPDSIPLNFLNPRPGTPLADLNDLTPLDCLKLISMIRLVLPRKELFVCGGRELNMKDEQEKMFDAGASGTMLGNYLTTQGRAADDDINMIRSLGLEVVSPHRTA